MAMSTASEIQWQLGMCWASTFHQLHEAALLKETDASAATVTAPPTGSLPACTCASQYIATAAAANLTQLQQLPSSAYKWAWGTQLTAAKVPGLHCRGTQPGPAPHTRYDISLAKGRPPAGEGSDMPASILSGQHEDVPADVFLPPLLTTLTHPPHFLSYDQLMYDPLYISASSIPNFCRVCQQIHL